MNYITGICTFIHKYLLLNYRYGEILTDTTFCKKNPAMYINFVFIIIFQYSSIVIWICISNPI